MPPGDIYFRRNDRTLRGREFIGAGDQNQLSAGHLAVG